MTEEEARHLATRIIDTWPQGAKHYIWKTLLQEKCVDPHIADVTYRLLRDTALTVPTTARFRAEYERQLVRLRQQPTQLFDADQNVIGMAEYRARLEHHPSVHGDTLTHWRKAWRLGDVIEALNQKDHHS